MKPFRFISIVEFESGWYKVMITKPGEKQAIFMSEPMSRTKACQMICVIENTEDFTEYDKTQEIELEEIA